MSFPAQYRLVAFFHFLALLFLALHGWVLTLPPTSTPIPGEGDAESAWWGLWPITYAPGWAVWAGALLVIGAIVWSWQSLWVGWTASSFEFRQWLWLPFLSLLIFASFLLFPIVHTRWGDAYILAKGIAYPDPTLRTVYSWQAPFTVRFHSLVWQWLGQARGWEDATPIYRLLSPLAGALYLAAALLISLDRRLRQAAEDGWLRYALLVSLGLLQLFFGYVENYSFAAAGVLLYLYAGLRVIYGVQSLWLAALILAIANAAHPSTVILAPSLLLLGWHCWRTRNYPWRQVVLQIVLPMAIMGFSVLLMMELGGHELRMLLTSDRPGGSDGRWFTPLWQTSTRWEHYTLFSWPHVRDLLNLQLLVAPIVAPSLIVLAITSVIQRTNSQIEQQERQAGRFLATAALSYLLFIVVWNADYGGQRDWDLFSLAALPLTLWLIWLLPRLLLNTRQRQAALLPLIMLQILHSAAWIYQNTLPWEWPK